MLLHLFILQQKDQGILLLTWSNKARQQDGILELATPAYLHFSEWHEAKPRTSLAADMSDRRHFDLFVAFDLTLLASLPLPDPQAPLVLTGTLRKWNPRPACGTAFSSVHNISSVFGLVPTRDEPAECLPWTR